MWRRRRCLQPRLVFPDGYCKGVWLAWVYPIGSSLEVRRCSTAQPWEQLEEACQSATTTSQMGGTRRWLRRHVTCESKSSSALVIRKVSRLMKSIYMSKEWHEVYYHQESRTKKTMWSALSSELSYDFLRDIISNVGPSLAHPFHSLPINSKLQENGMSIGLLVSRI